MKWNTNRSFGPVLLWITVIGGSWALLAHLPGSIDRRVYLASAAVTDAADLMCSNKYDSNLLYYQYDRPTKKWGLQGQPCSEITASGNKIEGFCVALNKCKAYAIDGKQLPGLPLDAQGTVQEQSSSYEDFSLQTETFSSDDQEGDPALPVSAPAEHSRINESFDDFNAGSIDRVRENNTMEEDQSLLFGLQTRAQEINKMTEYEDSDIPKGVRESPAYQDAVKLSTGISPATALNLSDLDTAKESSLFFSSYKPDQAASVPAHLSSGSTFSNEDAHFYDSFRRSENVEVQTPFGHAVVLAGNTMNNWYETAAYKVSNLWNGLFGK